MYIIDPCYQNLVPPVSTILFRHLQNKCQILFLSLCFLCVFEQKKKSSVHLAYVSQAKEHK